MRTVGREEEKTRKCKQGKKTFNPSLVLILLLMHLSLYVSYSFALSSFTSPWSGYARVIVTGLNSFLLWEPLASGKMNIYTPEKRLLIYRRCRENLGISLPTGFPYCSFLTPSDFLISIPTWPATTTVGGIHCRRIFFLIKFTACIVITNE